MYNQMDFVLNDRNSIFNSKSTIALIAGAGIIGFYIIIDKALYRLFDSLQEEQHQAQSIQPLKKPAGIYNQGNTCFVNSLLQALASLRSFQSNLQKLKANIKGHQDNNQKFIIELISVIKKINNNSQNIDVGDLLQLINELKEGLINFEQQDAHELYTAIISCFEETVNKQKQLDLSASIKFNQNEEENVENNLIGFTKSSIICTRCHVQTAIKIHPFYDLSLEIRSPLVHDLKSALREFQRQEIIQSWTCTNCTIVAHIKKIKKNVEFLKGKNKQKLTFIGKAIIQFLQSEDNGQHDITQINSNLQRFVLNYKDQYQNMIQDHQKDLIFIQLQGIQTTITKRTIITKYPKILVIHMKQLVMNTFSGQIQLIRKYIDYDYEYRVQVKTKEKVYHLTSLLSHLGNQSMGHYFTFRKMNRQEENWYVISDSSSKSCQWSYVKKNMAYMLFYQSD